jgi:hypothetical protein
MQTAFYNESMQAQKIAPGLSFMPYDPPSNYSGIQNLQGPNDNVFVNSIEVDGHYRLITDSTVALDFDPKSESKHVAFSSNKASLLKCGAMYIPHRLFAPLPYLLSFRPPKQV